MRSCHKWLSLLTMALPLAARADPASSLAFKAGPSAASQAADNRASRYGLAGGIAGYIQRPFSETWAFGGQVDLLYVPRGAKVVFDGEVQSEFQERYLDLDFLARPEMRIGRFELYALLGGGLNLLLSASKEKQDISDQLHRVDIALVAGAGASLRFFGAELGSLRLGSMFLEGRYDHGLLDHSIDGGLKNRTFSLMFGLSFVLTSQETARRSTPSTPIQ